MITPEESKVLTYLRPRLMAAAAEVVAACLPGSPAEWSSRVFSQLEWAGHVVVYYSPSGEPATLQITENGLRSLSAARPRKSPRSCATPTA